MEIEGSFLKTPFFPEKKVCLVLIDSRIIYLIGDELRKRNIEWIEVSPCKDLDYAVSAHPDMQCHPIEGKKIIVAPNASEFLKNQLIQHDFEILIGNTTLERNYPKNIAYNVARIGNVALHNFQYTDPVLKFELEKQGVKFINVNQGYAKCSIAVVDQNSIITSDPGIAKTASKSGLNVLLIHSGFIQLPGYKYGFIGGASGLVDEDGIAFVGEVHRHPDYIHIEKFLQSRGKKTITLGSGSLYDVGSIIPIKEELHCSAGSIFRKIDGRE